MTDLLQPLAEAKGGHRSSGAVSDDREVARFLRRYRDSDRLSAVLDTDFNEPYLHFEINGRETFILLDEELIRYCFVENSANYIHSPLRKRALEPMFGQGIVNADGEAWRRARKTVSAVFARPRMAGYCTIMQQAAREWVEGLPADASPVDVSAQVPQITFEILSRTLFSGELSADRNALLDGVSAMLQAYGEELLEVTQAPFWLPLSDAQQLARRAKRLRALLAEIIDRRIREGVNGRSASEADILDLLIAEYSADGQARDTRRRLEDNVISMMVAGFETTAQCIIWTIYLLARHPEWRAAARNEARQLHRGSIPVAKWHERSPVIRSILEESMRLYPPLPMLTRQAVRDDLHGPVAIHRGSVVMVVTALLHRLHRYWEVPERFDPGRFANDGTLPGPQVSNLAYLPFGIGPKACIGSAFAMREATIILAELLVKCDFAPADDEPARAVFRLANRPESPIHVALSPLGDGAG